MQSDPVASARRFIVNDLAAVNRNNTPWVVVNGHRPIYTTSSSGGGLASVTTVARDLRVALEDVFYHYEVSQTAYCCGFTRDHHDVQDTGLIGLWLPAFACPPGAHEPA